MQQTQVPTSVTEPETLATAPLKQEVVLSIVVPVMNEQENVRLLYDKLSASLDKIALPYEIIFVDDGSTDNTFLELKKLHDEHTGLVHVIRFRRHFGKTPALVAGFNRCRGDIIFTMDGDLQDDPEETRRGI
jgi:glycosyltransferase involved in cell wall biosynthesis